MERKPSGAKPGGVDLPSRDETAALEATGGDRELAHELLQTFLRGLPKELSDLRHCFQASDWPMLTETAHRIRGATGYCGVPALDDYLLRLQRSSESGEPDDVALALARVEQEALQLTGILDD